jgi:TPR repeat protein
MPAQKKTGQETRLSFFSVLPNKLLMAGPQPAPVRAQYQPDPAETGTATPMVPSESQSQLDHAQITSGAPFSSPPSQRKLDNEQLAILLRRGKDSIASGDIVAARLVLQRAADANDPEAALALGATYDPLVLRELRVYGLTADAAIARVWYEKARVLGSEAATRRLEKLTIGAR